MRAIVVDSQAARLETCPLNMRDRANLNTNEAAVEYVPKSLTSALEFDRIFSHFAPVEIDLGCGDGTFLTAMARENPEHNFLGIERLLGRVRNVCRKVARLDLKNARVLRMESSYAVMNLLPAGSVTAFHLLFPDPWPKRRHYRRRAFTHEFLFSIHRALIAGGLFHVATDHTEYFQQIEKVIAETDIFVISREQNDFPSTTFEQKFIARGLPVHRLLLRKVSPLK
jgi:tRNA (guanine-N7-)-methyltransferase